MQLQASCLCKILCDSLQQDIVRLVCWNPSNLNWLVEETAAVFPNLEQQMPPMAMRPLWMNFLCSDELMKNVNDTQAVNEYMHR